jgi:hypothetical protein
MTGLDAYLILAPLALAGLGWLAAWWAVRR